MPVKRLVIAPNWIGDAVMSLPILRALRRSHPTDSLIVLARRGCVPIYRAEGSAARTLTHSGLLRDASALRRERMDEAWLLPNSFRSALIPYLARVPVRIGYKTDGRGAFLTHALAKPRRTGHQLRDYDPLLRFCGIEPDTGPPRLAVPLEAARRAATAMASAGIGQDRELLVLAPGAAFGWTKRWPAERYGRLGDELARSGFARAVAIGPGEEALGAAVAAAARLPLPVIGADLDAVELAAVLARARCVVANDSGPMHLAAAVGTPVVAFFGPTDPGRTSPRGAAAEVLDRFVFCSPCFRTRCPYRHECMTEIAVEDAVRAVERVLGSG